MNLLFRNKLFRGAMSTAALLTFSIPAMAGPRTAAPARPTQGSSAEGNPDTIVQELCGNDEVCEANAIPQDLGRPAAPRVSTAPRIAAPRAPRPMTGPQGVAPTVRRAQPATGSGGNGTPTGQRIAPTPGVQVTVRGSSATYNFDGDTVNGSVDTGATVRQRAGINAQISDKCTNIFQTRRLEWVTAMNHAGNSADLEQFGNSAQWMSAYFDTLKCQNQCMSDSDIQFLMRCQEIGKVVSPTAPLAPLVFLERGEIDPCLAQLNTIATSQGRSTDWAGTPRTDGQLGTFGQPGVVCGARRGLEQRTLDAGLDFVLLIDNSKSMKNFRNTVISEIIPEFMNQTRSLPFHSRLILMTQELDSTRTVTVFDPRQENAARDASALVERYYMDRTFWLNSSEQQLEALSRHLPDVVRPTADVIAFILTDEGDSSPSSARAYAQRFRSMTTGSFSLDTTYNPADPDLVENYRTHVRTHSRLLPDMRNEMGSEAIPLEAGQVRNLVAERLRQITRRSGDRDFRLSERAGELVSVMIDGRDIPNSQVSLSSDGMIVRVSESAIQRGRTHTLTFNYTVR